jgi:hypothetical protein
VGACHVSISGQLGIDLGAMWWAISARKPRVRELRRAPSVGATFAVVKLNSLDIADLPVLRACAVRYQRQVLPASTTIAVSASPRRAA